MTQEKKLITPDTPTGAAGATAGTPPSKDGNAEKIDATPSSGAATTTAATPTTPSPTTESATRETEEQIVRPPAAHLLEEQQQQTVQATTTTTTPMQTTTTAATTPPTIAATTQQMPADKTAPDVNIFNVPDDTTIEQQPEMVVLTTSTTEMPYQSEQDAGSTENSAYASSTMPGHIQIASSESTDPSSWENFDNMLTTTVPTVATTGGAGGGGGAAANGNQPNTNGVNLQQRLPTGGPQSESVFIRLSNRIKALERNMSLSGQYLEELSRRYKKQVEELHQILNQQTQNVRTLEEQSRRHTELEQIYAQRNTQLKDELEDLRLQIHACVIVIIFVGGFLFLVLIIGILFYRAIYRKTKVLLSAGNSMRGQSQSSSNTTSLQSKPSNLKKAKRRKSFEDYPEPVAKAGTGDGGAGGMQSEKERRPSEEAMLILKQCSLDGQQQAAPQRQRKVSVFYGSGEQLLDTKSSSSSSGTKQSSKRKGEKHSWPSTQQQQKDRQSMQEGAGSLPRPRLAAGESAKPVKSKKKAQQQLFKRQESAPASSTIHERLNNSAPAACSTISDYDENLILDEDDLDNFLPNADLVYNEFMPDGPSGYQIANELAQQQQLQLQKQQQLLKPTKKSRRLSSPAFFKSPFGKNLKIKPKQHTPPHESTSWEWYRLSKNNQHNKAASGGGSAPATANLDTTSLSEINFPTDSTQNSYRILEEAILMSGESAMTARLNENNNGKKSAALASSGVMELNNGKRKGVGVVKSNSSVNSSSSSSGSVSNSSSSSGSNRSSCNGSCSNPSSTSSSSSCSNSTKKIKNRSLHNIFRKVF